MSAFEKVLVIPPLLQGVGGIRERSLMVATNFLQ
jgi:hypothetical protein